jgi:hypothetical protein
MADTPEKDQVVEYDFTGSISGFDFPPSNIDFCAENRGQEFDPSILASELDFGVGKRKNSASWLEYHGREDEAFERDK